MIPQCTERETDCRSYPHSDASWLSCPGTTRVPVSHVCSVHQGNIFFFVGGVLLETWGTRTGVQEEGPVISAGLPPSESFLMLILRETTVSTKTNYILPYLFLLLPSVQILPVTKLLLLLLLMLLLLLLMLLLLLSLVLMLAALGHRRFAFALTRPNISPGPE